MPVTIRLVPVTQGVCLLPQAYACSLQANTCSPQAHACDHQTRACAAGPTAADSGSGPEHRLPGLMLPVPEGAGQPRNQFREQPGLVPRQLTAGLACCMNFS